MAQKKATPTKEQQSIMRSRGLDPADWTVCHDLNHVLVIHHRYTPTVRVIKKHKEIQS
jgi:hypothetical protein